MNGVYVGVASQTGMRWYPALPLLAHTALYVICPSSPYSIVAVVTWANCCSPKSL